MNKISFSQKARIVLAIAAKDTLDALKNRTILSITFGILILMLSSKALPLLLAVRGTPILAVYNPAGWAAVQALAGRDDLQVISASSQEELESLLIESQQLTIGLVIPSGLAPDSGEIVLPGYTAHWANPARVRERVVFFEDALSAISGATVRIEVNGHVIYPSAETGMHLSMSVQTATILILLMGLMLVPYLFLEEKEQRTLDALLVSPASFSQLVTGKALAGIVYCLVAAAVIVLFNFRLIVHWEIAVLAMLLGGAFAVMAGLLLGTLVENQASLGVWMGISSLLLIGPAVVMSFSSAGLPAVIETIFSWSPDVAFNILLKLSMVGEAPVALAWKAAAALVIETLIVYALVVWRIRQMDR